jgi:hypothetical protein
VVARLASSGYHGSQDNYDTKGAWRFPSQSLPRVETHVYVKCPILSDFSRNWNVTTIFCKTLQCQIL